MGDGFILYDQSSNLVHHLNPTASIIWQLCDGTAAIGQLAGEIAEEFSRDYDVVFEEVATTVADLDGLKLVRNAIAGDNGAAAGPEVLAPRVTEVRR
jgi:hypothetical protein